jgi:hypothetical protein
MIHLQDLDHATSTEDLLLFGKSIGKTWNEKQPIFLWDSSMSIAAVKTLTQHFWLIVDEKLLRISLEEFLDITKNAQQWWKSTDAL